MSTHSTGTADAVMPPVELTLIVAATKNMGIGRGGTLPWTGLRKEMAYFARVTKRAGVRPNGQAADHPQPLINAVIMGRKTWDSVPERFRPLKGRINVVLSRSHADVAWDGASDEKEPVKLSSIAKALDGVARNQQIDRVFVIGGGEIYKEAAQWPQAKRILLTRILTDFECDTQFPVKLGEAEAAEWKKKSKAELDAWAGETVPEGEQEENGVRYVYEMYER